MYTNTKSQHRHTHAFKRVSVSNDGDSISVVLYAINVYKIEYQRFIYTLLLDIYNSASIVALVFLAVWLSSNSIHTCCSR